LLSLLEWCAKTDGVKRGSVEINVVIARAKLNNMHIVTKVGKKRRQMYGHVFTAFEVLLTQLS
jgi:hypothetical protein